MTYSAWILKAGGNIKAPTSSENVFEMKPMASVFPSPEGGPGRGHHRSWDNVMGIGTRTGRGEGGSSRARGRAVLGSVHCVSQSLMRNGLPHLKNKQTIIGAY